MRFAFQVKGKRSAYVGPVRFNHGDAESDRQIVAGSIAQLNKSLRPDAAFRALERLHAPQSVRALESRIDKDRKSSASAPASPGSASAFPTSIIP